MGQLILSKYNTNSFYGPVDNKTVLEPEDDVAHVRLGGKWRMPTKAELDTLLSQCTWTWTTKNGANGYEVKSKENSNSIFLPAAGLRQGAERRESDGGFWTSSLLENGGGYASFLHFGSDIVGRVAVNRCFGITVRPVMEE